MALPMDDLGAGWWREGVLYQVYPRSVADSNGDGTGDLRGITDHLDHLNGRADSLGIDAIWNRDLIRIRHGSGALRRRTYRAPEGLPDDVFGYIREHGRERWLILLNFADRSVDVPLHDMAADAGRMFVRLSTEPGRVREAIGSAVELAPDEGLLIAADRP